MRLKKSKKKKIGRTHFFLFLSETCMLARLLLSKLHHNATVPQRTIPLVLSSCSPSALSAQLSKMATATTTTAAEQPALKRVKLNCISPVPSDIDIAHAATPLHISRIATSLGLTEDDYDCYGKTMAKVRKGEGWRLNSAFFFDDKAANEIDDRVSSSTLSPSDIINLLLLLFPSFSSFTLSLSPKNRSSSPSSTASCRPRGASTSSSRA